MRKLAVLALAVVLLAGLAAAAVAQTQHGFQTRVEPIKMTPGAKVEVQAIFPDVNNMPPLAINSALFIFGIRYAPPTVPFVIPAVPFGIAEFQRVPFGTHIGYVATFGFQVPKDLPPNLKIDFYLQGVAVEQTKTGLEVLFAMPVHAQLLS
jgi:hypothetical protein